MLGTFFGYDLHYCLWRLTFAQALTLIDIRNEREKQQQEEAERRAKTNSGDVPDGSTWTDISEYDVNNKSVDELPDASELRSIFSRMMA